MEERRDRPAVPLARSERTKARQRKAPSPRILHEAIRREGFEELARPSAALFWSGLAAGLSMGFSLVGEGVLRAGLPDAEWTPLVAKLGYTLGFLFVILGRQQLFTEQTLTVVLPFLAAPGARQLAQVARVWGIVLAANVLGSAAFAWGLGRELFSPEHQAAFSAIGRRALEPGPGEALLRGVYGGWLIALMVWLLPAARGSRFLVIVAVTWLVGAAEFSHVVAGSADVLYLVFAGEAGVGTYVAGFFAPVLAGNILGGVSLVAALNHAQVVAGEPHPPRKRLRRRRERDVGARATGPVSA
jgi:formate/nitrite transporter FocA (FNT family)